MKERPILFSTEMARAILEGRKSQTRRIIKYPKIYKLNELIGWKIKPHKDTPVLFSFWYGTKYTLPAFRCPYGQPGDVLWVKETFLIEKSIEDKIHYEYKSDYSETMADDVCWKPSIFMPKEASRLKLKVTDIRVERVQDITEEDAIAEGVEYVDNQRVEGEEDLCRIYLDYMDNESILMSAKSSYKSLWSKINGKDSWKSNPWVWVVEFEKI